MRSSHIWVGVCSGSDASTTLATFDKLVGPAPFHYAFSLVRISHMAPMRRLPPPPTPPPPQTRRFESLPRLKWRIYPPPPPPLFVTFATSFTYFFPFKFIYFYFLPKNFQNNLNHFSKILITCTITC